MKNKAAASCIFLCLIFALLLFGAVLFKAKFFSWAILSAVILLLGVFFTAFEKKDSSAREVVIIAVLSALSIIGRVIFAAIPGFKPCTAVIIIAGVYFGRQEGFMVGSLTALVSNFYYGQGLWTPFQMIVWGLTGYIAGMFSTALSKSKPLLIVYGALSGLAFSLFMDLWSCIWADNAFILSRYLAMLASSAGFTLIYAVSNVIFLLLLMNPAQRIFTRLRQKYGV